VLFVYLFMRLFARCTSLIYHVLR